MTREQTIIHPQATSLGEVTVNQTKFRDIEENTATTSAITSSTDVIQEKHLVHWFRKGLRLHDNPALLKGLQEATTFRCVFVIDPWFAGSSNVGINKWRWA